MYRLIRFYNQNKNVILRLHFESFSKGIKEIIIDSDIDKKIRDAFVEIQQDYLDTCRSIGLTPLVDEKKIQSFLEFSNALLFYNSLLITDYMIASTKRTFYNIK